MADIKAVVFDVGGVLVNSPLIEFAKVDAEYGLREGTAMSLFRGGSDFVLCETGRIPFAEFAAAAVAGIEADQGIAVPPERLATMMAAIMGDAVDPPMAALVLELKAAGVRIGLLSNIYAELDGWLRAAFPAGTVDIFAPSYLLGERKPDPAAYEGMRAIAGLEAPEIVFVDDFVENVDAANAAGMHGILFTGAGTLRTALRALGVPA